MDELRLTIKRKNKVEPRYPLAASSGLGRLREIIEGPWNVRLAIQLPLTTLVGVNIAG